MKCIAIGPMIQIDHMKIVNTNRIELEQLLNIQQAKDHQMMTITLQFKLTAQILFTL